MHCEKVFHELTVLVILFTVPDLTQKCSSDLCYLFFFCAWCPSISLRQRHATSINCRLGNLILKNEQYLLHYTVFTYHYPCSRPRIKIQIYSLSFLPEYFFYILSWYRFFPFLKSTRPYLNTCLNRLIDRIV